MNTTSTQRKVFIFGNSYSLTNHLLKTFLEKAKEAIERRGRFVVALSGGKTPVEFYCRLSNFEDFDIWSRTHIFWTDERFVPSDHKDSNYRLVKDNLFNYINIPKANIHKINGDLENASIAAEEYKDELCRFFDIQKDELPQFDFMLLGIGEDGHTASIFPNQFGANDRRRLTMPVEAAHLKEDRISLTFPVINNSRAIYLIACSQAKAQVMADVIDRRTKIPASEVVPYQGELNYLLDRHAASLLKIDEDAYSHLDDAIVLNR